MAKELSVLISADDPTDQFLISKAIAEINSEADINIVYTTEQLLDFMLKSDLQRDLNRQNLPDVVIANYSFPFSDLKIIADIRKREDFRNVPIYVLVDEKITNTRVKYLEYGVTEVYQKPATYLHLKQIIEKILMGL